MRYLIHCHKEGREVSEVNSCHKGTNSWSSRPVFVAHNLKATKSITTSLDRILVHHRGYPWLCIFGPIYTPGWREAIQSKVSCLSKQHIRGRGADPFILLWNNKDQDLMIVFVEVAKIMIMTFFVSQGCYQAQKLESCYLFVFLICSCYLWRSSFRLL